MSLRICQIKALARLSVLELYRRKDLIVVFVLCAVILLPLMVFTPLYLNLLLGSSLATCTSIGM